MRGLHNVGGVEIMWDFYMGLMEVIGRGRVSKSLWDDMYWVRDNLDGGDAGTYERLCFVAVRLARGMKCRLPDALHNRMLLGEGNVRTRQYFEYCSRNGF